MPRHVPHVLALTQRAIVEFSELWFNHPTQPKDKHKNNPTLCADIARCCRANVQANCSFLYPSFAGSNLSNLTAPLQNGMPGAECTRAQRGHQLRLRSCSQVGRAPPYGSTAHGQKKASYSILTTGRWVGPSACVVACLVSHTHSIQVQLSPPLLRFCHFYCSCSKQQEQSSEMQRGARSRRQTRALSERVWRGWRRKPGSLLSTLEIRDLLHADP